MKKRVLWIVIRVESLILRRECKALSERDSCVCILEMRTEAMHVSISADWAVGTKYYLAVRRSWSWYGRHLQCMWMHVVKIPIPITKRIAIRNVFRNVIRSFVNTAITPWNFDKFYLPSPIIWTHKSVFYSLILWHSLLQNNNKIKIHSIYLGTNLVHN